MYKMILSGVLEQYYEIPRENSWMIAAAEKNLPIVVPWMGRFYHGQYFRIVLYKRRTYCNDYEIWYRIHDVFSRIGIRKTQQEKELVSSRLVEVSQEIFPICVVPMLYQDMEMHDIPFWSYFCQISDSTTSYGSYSGAVPNEKITWGKLDITTPKIHC